MEAVAEKREAARQADLPKHTAMKLASYDRERHVPLDDAYALVKSQKSDALSTGELTYAIDQGEIHVYDFKGKKYIDRLDMGRMYHRDGSHQGLHIEKKFSEGFDPIAEYTARLEKRDAFLEGSDGDRIFEMKDALFTPDWTTMDAGIIAQKYFFKPHKEEWKKKMKDKLGRDHEYSPHHLAARVTNWIVKQGEEQGYFRTDEDRESFRDELNWMQLNRRFAFNSPVQFNAGLFSEYGIEGSKGVNYWRNPQTGKVERITDGCNIRPQCHACFISGPRDDLEDLLNHAVDESSIFSAGSGIGHDLSGIRGDGEPLSSGGEASGPMSFLIIYDDVAGTIKSGGKSRRAARMTTMKGGSKEAHRDIVEFVRKKVGEDRKALILMQNGYEPGMDGEAYGTVTLQNTNLSVRLDSEFFDKVNSGGEIELRNVTDNSVSDRIDAERLLKEISFGSWRIGDPGVQYETPIQEWHTTPNSGRINSSNPCSEFMNVDNTSCNLGSHNLLAYTNEKGDFDTEAFVHATRIGSIALDIINGGASYPVEEIATVSPEFASIGIGYANLGALLMRKGLGYDSDEGRNFAAGITALMTGVSYETSSEMAENIETFTQYEFNKKPMQGVIRKHNRALDDVVWEGVQDDIKKAAYRAWRNANKNGREHGFRNSQVSLLAPTGTVSSLMGCDTTGVESSISLKINKDLAGGGSVMVINREVPNALGNLGYSPQQIEEMMNYLDAANTLRGAPGLNPEHYGIFDTSLGNQEEIGSISVEGHIKMMGALQPFLSGAISKTVNLPESATVKDFFDGYMLGNELGVKAIAAFRSGSKPISPYSFAGKDYVEPKRGEKEEIPTVREGAEYELKFHTEHGEVPFHILVSEYPDGRPGQIAFLSYKSGSTLGATFKSAGVLASKALTRGVHLDDICESWIDDEFEPNGFVSGYPHIGRAKSPLDAAGKIILIEYRKRIDLARDPESVDETQLRGFKNGAFETYEDMEIDDWDVDQVLNDPKRGGFKNGNGKKKKNKKPKKASGLPCKKCGGLMTQTKPNCFQCNSCSNNIGGCTA